MPSQSRHSLQRSSMALIAPSFATRSSSDTAGVSNCSRARIARSRHSSVRSRGMKAIARQLAGVGGMKWCISVNSNSGEQRCAQHLLIAYAAKYRKLCLNRVSPLTGNRINHCGIWPAPSNNAVQPAFTSTGVGA